MTPEFALEVGKQALILVLILSAPVLLLGLGVGVIISILQSVTQIQEMTLTFVPKIIGKQGSGRGRLFRSKTQTHDRE